MKQVIFLCISLLAFSQNLFADQVKVGISVPLTGNASEYGNAAKNGFILAQEQKPELQRFDYIFDDNVYQAVKSLDSYRRLRAIDGLNILYVWGEPGFNSIAPVAEAEKFPFFCMSTDRGPGVGKKYAIRVSGDSYQLASKLIQFLEIKKADSIDLLMADDPFFEAGRLALREVAKPDLKINTIATVPTDSMDFRSLILRLRSSKPRFIGVFLMAGQVRTFFTQASSLGLNSQFIGTDVFESTEEIRESGSLINGSIYVNFYVPKEFYISYTERFGNDSQISHAYMAYALALSLPTLAPQNVRISPESVLENVTKLDWKSTGEVFAYKDSAAEGKHFEFPVVLREVKDGTVFDVPSVK